MNIENIQQQLAESIINHHQTWSQLLVNTNLGNFASTLWNVKVAPNAISVDVTQSTFTFQNAHFEFDVEVGLSFGDDNHLYSKYISGKGNFQLIENKKIHLKTLILN